MDNRERKREVDLTEYWRVIIKRKWVIIVFAGTIILFTGVFSFLATPVYRSTATLLIEEDTSKILSIDEAFGYYSPVFRDMTFLNTQLELLKSKSLAERVVNKLDLLSNPEFASREKKATNTLAFIKNIFSKKKSKPVDPDSAYRPDPVSELAETIQKGLSVNPVLETKLVEVSYSSPHKSLE